MIYGKNKEQRSKIVKERESWHRYYAWFPVKLDTGFAAWLEWVERKGTWECGYDGGEWVYEYREIN